MPRILALRLLGLGRFLRTSFDCLASIIAATACAALQAIILSVFRTTRQATKQAFDNSILQRMKLIATKTPRLCTKAIRQARSIAFNSSLIAMRTP